MEKLILLMKEFDSKKAKAKELDKEIVDLDNKVFDIKMDLVEKNIVKYNGKTSNDWSFYAGTLEIYIHDLGVRCSVLDVDLISKKEIYQEDNVVYLSDYKKLRAA